MYVELFLKNVKRIRIQFKELEIYLIKGFSKVIATVNEYQKMLSTIQLLKKKQIKTTCCITAKISVSKVNKYYLKT